MKRLLLIAALASPGCLGMSPAQTAAAVQTTQCERYVAVLKAGKDADMSCVDARAAAEKAEPLCSVSIKCPGEK